MPSITSDKFHDLESHFESSLTKAYTHILEFYARALCYLQKTDMAKLLNDTFDSNSWQRLLSDITSSEAQCMSFKDLIDGEKLHRGLEEQQIQLQYITKLLVREAGDSTTTKHPLFGQCMRKLHTCPYEDRKNRSRRRVLGTCEWFVTHELFNDWKNKSDSSLLLVSADPGCGKSVLARYLIDEVLQKQTDRTTCYFCFKDDFADQKSSADAVCALIRQVLWQNPDLLQDSLAEKLEFESH